MRSLQARAQATSPHPFKIGFAQHTHPIAAPEDAIKAASQRKGKKAFSDEHVFIALDVADMLAGARALGEGLVVE